MVDKSSAGETARNAIVFARKIDGALIEIEGRLRCMRELAVKAAVVGCELETRICLDREFQRLKMEIFEISHNLQTIVTTEVGRRNDSD